MNHDDKCSCSRRSFLRGCGLTLTGFTASSLFPGAFMRDALAMASGDERFFFIFMRGGNDGINATIPHGDPDYNATNRAGIYIPPGQAIDLNGFASAHPAMADVMDAYDAGELAVIHRVGLPDHSLSHFDDQRVWENGLPDQPRMFEGWLARYIRENLQDFDGDLPIFAAQPTPPVLLRGGGAFVNISDPAGFYNIQDSTLQNKYIDAWRKTYNEFDGLQAYRPLLSQTGVALFDTLDEYKSWDQNLWDPKDPDNPTWSLFPVNGVTNPPDASTPTGLKFSPDAYSFFINLKICALALLEGAGTSNGTRVAGTQINGFDTHTAQGGTSGRHAELLSWLAYGLRSLRILFSGAAIEPRGYPAIWDKTVVSTMSEFGRTSKTNTGFGTDYAMASCMWMQGGPVNGGVYNCDSSKWPTGTMFSVNGRYVQPETDFRAVFWEALRDHMGAPVSDLELIYPGYTTSGLAAQELGLISTT